jgi:putative membrane protein
MYKKNSHYIVFVLGIFYLVGIIIHLLPVTQHLALSLTEPQLLLVNSALLGWLVYQQRSTRFIFWFLFAFVFSVSLEMIGVKTGLIFGEYYYGDTMNLKILRVPVVIGLNWVILILGGYALARLLSKGIVAVLLSGIIVVLFDFVMEPVAMILDYWQWEGNSIPLQNYVAWFLITIILVSILYFYKITINSIILKGYFIIQFVFFLTLRFFIV